MKFLTLARRVGLESGTVGNPALPASVAGQAGRLLRIVNWTADAWRLIQEAQFAGWKWQRSSFSKLTTSGLARYPGDSAPWSIDRFRRYMQDDEFNALYPFSIYKQSDGVAYEGDLRQIPLEGFIHRYQRGTQTPGPPAEYAIDEDGALLLGPTPDDIYVINGRFLKTDQILTLDADVPEMPSGAADPVTSVQDAHMIIVWRAVMLVGEHDEGAFQIASAKAKFIASYDRLLATQQDRITIRSEPIA